MHVSQKVDSVIMPNLRHIIFLCKDEDIGRFS